MSIKQPVKMVMDKEGPDGDKTKVKVEVDKSHKKVYLTEYHPFEKRTHGQKIADKVTGFGGSWMFMALFFLFLVLWAAVNVYYFTLETAPDPYPFILLNLILSCLAAIQAPIILMSQNRAAQRDRIKAEHDYLVNRKTEREVHDMQQDLDEIKKLLRKLVPQQPKQGARRAKKP